MSKFRVGNYVTRKGPIMWTGVFIVKATAQYGKYILVIPANRDGSWTSWQETNYYRRATKAEIAHAIAQRMLG